MKSYKTIAAILALCLSGVMLTACGNNDDADRNGDTTSTSQQTNMRDETVSDTENSISDTTENIDVSEITGEDNPGRSRDIDGDGFIEDVVTAAEDIVDDVVTGAENIIDDIIPNEHDDNTVTTTNME